MKIRAWNLARILIKEDPDAEVDIDVHLNGYYLEGNLPILDKELGKYFTNDAGDVEWLNVQD